MLWPIEHEKNTQKEQVIMLILPWETVRDWMVIAEWLEDEDTVIKAGWGEAIKD